MKYCSNLTIQILLAAGLVSLSACSVPGITIFANNDPGTSLATGESATVHFFTTASNHDTGIQLQSGSSYRVDMILLSNWIDGPISETAAGDKIDEKGFENSQMRSSWLAVFKRQRDHQWFELMLYQPACAGTSRQGVSDLAEHAEGGYTYVASCDGKLSLFVNDTYGFYLNNQGYANIALTRLN